MFHKRSMVEEWNLMSSQGNDLNLLSRKNEDHIAQVHSNATGDGNSGCKGRSGHIMEEARNNPSMATGESQEQEGGHSRSTKRQKESPLCFTDGHLSSQKR